VDTSCIPNGLSTVPNVGDMFGDTRCHPVGNPLSGGYHDNLTGQPTRQCSAPRIGRAA
jgi:hypothetical protein